MMMIWDNDETLTATIIPGLSRLGSNYNEEALNIPQIFINENAELIQFTVLP